MSPDASFPQFLKSELGRRRSKNSGYSLRAFAKTLGVSSSFLSKVLNGKKAVGKKSLVRMASRLGVEVGEIAKYLATLDDSKIKNLNFTPLAADHFQFISDWYHYAILEAITLDDYEPSIAWLSKKLNITETQADRGVERLIRLGYLERNSDNSLNCAVKNHTTTHLPIPTDACREHERQVLEMAILALDQIDVNDRDQSSITMAIPKSRLPAARKKIDTFRREMNSFLQKRGKRDELVHLSISLYPITQFKKEN